MFVRMWQANRMQSVPPKPSAVPRVLDRMVRLRPAQAWLLILFCTDVVALADFLTVSNVWFGPAYLIVICVAAWSLGWRAGQLTGLSCMGLTFALNGLTLYPHGGADFAWNFGLRFMAISTVIAVVAGVRRAYVTEWWLGRTDFLTGALNRQAFFELAPSFSKGWRLLVYADLDGLKKVNDFQGHAAGDSCLKVFGTSVRKMIRSNDIFARVGGDEFLIFMNVKDEAAARAVGLRLHRAMNSISTECGDLKCSVGALAVPPGEASVDALVRGADNLMYEAKLRGACLQLGVASHVRAAAIVLARETPRTSSNWVFGRKMGGVDRRTGVVRFANEGVPR